MMPKQYPEQALQRACVQILARLVPTLPEGGPFWTAINPVPAKSKAVAGISKAMGLRAGVPDLLIIFGKPIFVEFKAKGGSLSPEQKRLHPEIIAGGGVVEIVRTVDEFVAVLDKYGIPCRILRRTPNCSTSLK